MSKSNEAILVDAYAQIYRSFYAVRLLTSSDGRPVNAIFAMAKFLLKLEHDHPCESGAFVFDKGRPAYRLELEPNYKANRPPMPDPLRAQLEDISEMIRLFGWPVFIEEGVEADDIIASIVTDLPDRPFLIASSDKDLSQLVDDRVRMLSHDKKGSGLVVCGPDDVAQKFGVPPARVLDLLALTGDASDNIRGVDGVGPKTAAKLVNDFGSVDMIVKNADSIESEKLREKIKAAADFLPRNLRLITLNREAASQRPWKDDNNLSKRAPDWAGLKLFFERHEFKSLVAEAEKRAPAPSEPREAVPDDDLFSTPKRVAETEDKNQKKEGDMYTPDLFS